MSFIGKLDGRLQRTGETSVEVRRKTATVLVASTMSLLAALYIGLRLHAGGFNNAVGLVMGFFVCFFSLFTAIALLATRDARFCTGFAHVFALSFLVALPAMAVTDNSTDNPVYPYVSAPMLPVFTSFTLPSHRPMLIYTSLFIVVAVSVTLATQTAEELAADAPHAAITLINVLVVLFSLTIFSGVADEARADTMSAKWELAAAEAKRDAATSANEAKARFVSILSHEIRNPLQALLLQLEMVESMDLDASLAKLVRGMIRATNALSSIANDILYVSKIDARAIRIVTAPVDLRTIADEAIAAVAAEVAERDVEVLVNIPPSLDTLVLGDRVRIAQVLGSLLSNAVKFTKEGEVEVTVVPLDEPATKWRIAVRDTGIGIDDEGLPKLFQSFTQVDETTTRRFGGMGLGLFVAKELTSLMGGSVSVESVPGSGSTFAVTLPLPRLDRAALARCTETPRRPVRYSHAAQIRWTVAIVATRRSLIGMLRDHVRYYFCNNVQVVTLDRPVEVEHRLRSMRQEATPRRPLLALVNHSDCTIAIAALLRKSTEEGCSEARHNVQAMATVLLAAPAEATALTDYGWCSCVAKPASLASACAAMDDAVVSLLERRQQPRSDTASSVQRPVAPEGAAPPTTIAAVTASTVLIVDDFAMVRDLVSSIVQSMGFQTLLAGDGREALSLVRQFYDRISMVLMDCEMPVLDGYAATEGIRQYEQNRGVARTEELYVCAMTANAMREDAQECYARSMSGVLTKPLVRADLARVLAEHARLPAERRMAPTGLDETARRSKKSNGSGKRSKKRRQGHAQKTIPSSGFV